MTLEPGTYQTQELIDRGYLQIGDGYRAKNSELSIDGIPFARAGNINNGFLFEGADCFPVNDLEKVGEKRSCVFDSVFTSKGTVGRIAFVKNGTQEFVYSPQLCYWRSKIFDEIEPRFLNYWMNGAEFRNQIAYLKGQTDMADYVSLRDQRRMTITIPDIEKQKWVSSVLGTVDDKIGLNRQTNQTLEQIAQAIFKSWFVDFDPVRAKIAAREAFIQQHPEVTLDAIRAAANTEGDTPAHAGAKACELAAICAISGKTEEQLSELSDETQQELKTTAALFPDALVDAAQRSANIAVARCAGATTGYGEVPVGWEVKALDKKIIPKKGKNITKATITPGAVPVVAGGLTPAYYHNAHNVTAPVITISASGANAGFINLYHQNIWASDCSFINKEETEYLYSAYLLIKNRQDEITKMQQGAAQPHVYPKDLARLILVDPPDELWEELEGIVRPFFEITSINIDEIYNLEQLRNFLLPKLLSGELQLEGVA